MPEGRSRLDQLLVARGFLSTRAKATDAIRRGAVMVDGRRAEKPAQMVAADAVITLDDDAGRHVSRAGLKLEHALDAFAIDPAGLVCLDIGASTGGFTQVLLLRGAARVYAVDVGHGQLAPSLREDARVVDLSGTDARTLSPALIPDPVDLVVTDVSFIGLAKALPAALALARPDARLVALVKPQFEVGPGLVGKDGVVRDEAAREAALDSVAAWLAGAGWTVTGTTPSPIAGKAGNVEFLIAARN